MHGGQLVPTVVAPLLHIGVTAGLTPAASHKRKAETQVVSATSPAVGGAARDDDGCVSTVNVRPGCRGSLNPVINLAGFGPAVSASQDEEGGPWVVDVSGFQRSELNGHYTARPDVLLSGRRTYWTRNSGATAPGKAGNRYFLAWVKALSRWTICEWPAVMVEKAGDCVPNAEEVESCEWQAFQLDAAGGFAQWAPLARLLACTSNGHPWMQRGSSGGGPWRRAEAVRVTPTPPLTKMPAPPIVPPAMPAQSGPTVVAVTFTGFRRLELNARYSIRTEIVLNGKPSHWVDGGAYFMYWQGGLRRWAICAKRHLESVKRGQCPGCACQMDTVHLSLPSRWVEYVDGGWVAAPVDVVVILEETLAVPSSASSSALDVQSVAPAELADAFVKATLAMGNETGT